MSEVVCPKAIIIRSKSKSEIICEICKSDFNSINSSLRLPIFCKVCLKQSCKACCFYKLRKIPQEKSSRICTECLRSKILSTLLQELHLKISNLSIEKETLSKQLAKSTVKLDLKLEKCNKRSQKIHEFNKKIKDDALKNELQKEELNQHRSKLTATQNTIKISLEGVEIILNTSKETKKSVESDLEQAKVLKDSVHEVLCNLRNNLAALQDENLQMFKKIDDLKSSIEKPRVKKRNLSRKESLRWHINDQALLIEDLANENASLIQEVMITEEFSQKGSVFTTEEASTNHEEEENLKELSLRIKEQYDSISKLKLRLQSQDDPLRSQACTCSIS